MTSSSEAASVRKDGRPFRRILIANRGEIALRIIRTCRDLRVETVAVYSDADADAAHVHAADAAVRIGTAAATDSYLRMERILEAALESRAEAIHPGYGFLSERAAFAQATADAGLVFVGPDARAIEALGDKLAARRSLAAVDVPVVPGTFEPAPTDRPDAVDAIIADADRVGFPLLVKASAGGGGRGMRRVANAAELPAALAAGAAEALAAFGDGAVYLEREIRPARHIEVQLLGDAHGTVVALGERDCSIQRRHQKLLEESPAPGLSDEERATVHGHAVRAAQAAGLQNAATAEFLFDTERRFWFLEVNARLQVEHGVTELVTGLDLVAEQLWIAAGHRLRAAVMAAAERASRPERHAIEVRLSAEDPSTSFSPTPGRIGRWIMPSGPGVRVDTAIRAGERVPPEYDPMIAKILTTGDDRGEAIARMARALDEVEVTGLQTTLPFHRWLLETPAFQTASFSTGLVDSDWDGATARAHVSARAAQAAAEAAVERSGRLEAGEPASLSLRTDGTDASSGWRTLGRRAGVARWPR